MFCGNCGAKLPDDAKFCGSCGATVESIPVKKPVQQAAPVRPVTPAAPVKPPKQAPQKTTRKAPKKPGAMIGGIVGAVAVVALVVVLVLTLFGGDAAKVAKAMAKTAGAYTDAAEKLNLPEVNQLLESGEFSQEVSVWLEGMEYYEELEGVGARMTMDFSTKDKVIGMNLVPYFGSVDIVDVQLKLADSNLHLGSNELTGGNFYHINTETLGEDLAAMELADESIETLGFNVFTVMEQMKAIQEENKEAVKIVSDAAKNLGKAVEVEKTGKESMDINDNDVKCTVYHVMIPEDALGEFLGALEEAYESMDTTGAYLEILESIGIPKEVLDEMEYGMDSSDEMFEALDDVLDELGDVELDMYISDGYVMSVVYEGDIDGTDLEIALDLGGGKNYVDDLSIEIIAGENEIALVSNGDHGCKDGEFTDKTTLDMTEYGEAYRLMTSKMTYDPAAEEDNLSWTISTEYTSVKMEGTMTSGKDSMYLRLDEISVSEYDTEVVALGAEYSLGAYAGDNMDTGDSVALAELSEDELYEEAEMIAEDFIAWAERMKEEFPDLIYALS